MRVLLTGATGFVGSAVVAELLEGRHDVVGHASSDRAAATLTAAGIPVHRCDLEDLESLRSGAAAADGVIHAAFTDLSATTDVATSVRTDVRAIAALGAGLDGSGKPLVIASATMMVVPGRVGTEADPASPGMPRVPAENLTLSLAERGVRASIVRLAPSVHGDGDRAGCVARLIAIARATGVSAFVGDGSNRWPAVHRRDAARLFRLAAEAAPAGSRLHAVGEQGVPFREIAEAIGRHLGLPVTSILPDAADGHFGALARTVSADNPTSSTRTQELLGSRPLRPGLLTDIVEGRYVDVTAAVA